MSAGPGLLSSEWFRAPLPGSAAERDVIAARQPGFLSACQAGVAAARAAQCADGRGNISHAGWQSYCRFMALALGLPIRRVLDPLSTPLERKFREVDLIESWAWWLVTQVGVNTETAWTYVCAANACHERLYMVGFAGGMSLRRIRGTLNGYQRLLGHPILRRRRIGVRPAHLAQSIRAHMSPRTDAHHANLAACMEVALVAIARAGELASTRASLPFTPGRHPSRNDVRFDFDGTGALVGCTIWIINSKARGANWNQKLPVHLPIRGKHLSPGLALYHLCCVIDPVPQRDAASTPLFRNPSTGAILTVDDIRRTLRAGLAAIGRDASLYGAHSLRIGGATALAWTGASGDDIQAAGRWHSSAYLRYLRETRHTLMTRLVGVASADTDDMEADFIEVDRTDFDADDEA